MKRIIQILLVLSIILSNYNLGNIQVKANESNNIIINNDSISLYSNREKFNTISECATYIRNQLVERNLNIDFELVSNETDSNALIEQLMDEIFKHTSNPKEGDYLYFHYQSFLPSGYYTPSTSTYTLNFKFEMYTTLEEEKLVDKKVSEIIQLLDLDNKSELDKILSIYDYITSNVTYDYDNLYDDSYTKKYTAYAALFDGTSVCQGYSNLFYRLCLEAGIDNRIISGFSNNEAHSWNIVKLNNKYYNVDATWDSGNFYYNWLLKSNNDFVVHTRDSKYTTNEFNQLYPMSNQSYQFDEETGIIDNFEYQIIYDRVFITKVNNNSEELITIPSFIDGYPVVGLEQHAIVYNDTVRKIVINEGLISLANESIMSCSNLEILELPSTLKLFDFQSIRYLPSLKEIKINENNKNFIIKDKAVYTSDMKILIILPPKSGVKKLVVPEGVEMIDEHACSYNETLEEVILPESIHLIRSWAFEYSKKLNKINMPNNCWYIGQWSFAHTSIKSIHIPASVEIIGTYAFDTPSFEKITLDEDNPYFYMIDGMLFSPQIVYEFIDGTILVLDDVLVVYPLGDKREELVIPYGTKSIDAGAFVHSENLRTIVMPETITYIDDCIIDSNRIVLKGKAGSYAEQYALKKNLCFINENYNGASGKINDSVKWNLNIDGKLTIFGEGNTSCDIENLDLKKYFTLIYEIEIGEGVTSIYEYLFQYMPNLEKITLSNTIESIDIYAFVGCPNLKEINVDKNNKNYVSVNGVLYNKSKDTLIKCPTKIDSIHEFPKELRTIGLAAFYDSKISSITLPNTLLSIETSAFEHCENLKSITLPGSINFISDYVFSSNLEKIIIGKNTSGFSFFTFIKCTNAVFYVVEDSYAHRFVIKNNFKYEIGTGNIEIDGIDRIFGNTRYQTAMEVADALKEELGVDKFDTVIIATGVDYPDALAGSYLAGKKNAPILMVNDRYMDDVANYVKNNVVAGGQVYILGGEKAVSPVLETKLSGYGIKRLAGANRFETNLLILKEAEVTNEDILVCTGYDFADSLSASATERPILLVHPKSGLNAAQKEFLSSVQGNKMYVIGGVNAVSNDIYNAVSAYASTIERIGGATRNETSVLIAEEFFESPTCAVVAYSRGFPDGLAGGPLAIAKKAPLILTQSNSTSAASSYMRKYNIKSGDVLGGPILVTDEAVRVIFNK